jgi:hypothetical protein
MSAKREKKSLGIALLLGSARVSRVGLKACPLLRIRCSGLAPKQAFHRFATTGGAEATE